MQPQDVPLIRLIQKGPQALSNPELLSILLGKDVNWGKYKTTFELAHEIFQKYDIKKLSQSSIGELDKIFGIGKIRAAHIQAMFELARRLSSYTEELKPLIEKPEDVFKILSPEMQKLEQECFKVVLLDNRNRMIKHKTVTLGILDTNLIHPRELFRPAIDNNAASIILVHNHPSGDPTPSDADIQITKQIIEAGKLLKIDIQDHIIIGVNSHISLRDKVPELW